MELNNEPIYKASQSKVSTVVAYLIGAKEDMFSYYSGDSNILAVRESTFTNIL